MNRKLPTAPRRGLLIALTMALALCVAPLYALADSRHGIPLPKRTRVHKNGELESRHSFRRTVRFFKKHFKKKSVIPRIVKTYSYRGVTIARFLAPVASTAPWLAVHVYRAGGRTYIHVVPRRQTKADDKEP